MSTGKIIGIIVVIIVIAGGYWWWSQNASMGTAEYGGAAMSTSSPSDASDSAIDQDTAAIDAQLDAAVSDSSAANSSINDTPVAQ